MNSSDNFGQSVLSRLVLMSMERSGENLTEAIPAEVVHAVNKILVEHYPVERSGAQAHYIGLGYGGPEKSFQDNVGEASLERFIQVASVMPKAEDRKGRNALHYVAYALPEEITTSLRRFAKILQ